MRHSREQFCPSDRCTSDSFSEMDNNEDGSVIAKRYQCNVCGCEFEDIYEYAETVITFEHEEETEEEKYNSYKFDSRSR